MRRKEMGIIILQCVVKPYDKASAAWCSNTGTALLEKGGEEFPLVEKTNPVLCLLLQVLDLLIL
jgi:hypothetical protein